MNKVLPLIIVLLVVGGAYYFAKNMNNSTNSSNGRAVFSDPDFPFTFEYPAEWKRVEIPNSYVKKDVLIGRNVERSAEDASPGEWFEIIRGAAVSVNPDLPEKDVSLDGRKFTIYAFVRTYIVILQSGNETYEIHFSGENMTNPNFEHLVRTFRFVK